MYGHILFFGTVDMAHSITLTAFTNNHSSALLPPIYAMLANIQIAHARKAPKLLLSGAREFL